MSETVLSIIIVNWNTRDITLNCLRSIGENVAGLGYEVIVVDNASTDGSRQAISKEYPAVTLIANETNVGFGRANNQAMRVAHGRYLLLLNSDTVIIDDSIQRLVECLEGHPETGVAACKLLFEDRELQCSCYRFPSMRIAILEELALYKFLPRRRQGEILLTGYWPHDRERDVDWVSGAVMLLRREVFEETGGFDETIFMYGEDMEWCMRIADIGWAIKFVPDCEIVHLSHKSADLMYGEKRIALCHQRFFEIYQRRSGYLASKTMMLLKATGAFIRVCYFGSQVAASGNTTDYVRSQSRFYRNSLKYHVQAFFGVVSQQR
jgi:GT2 family glycosyltransferase